jgi:hypothetical protein
VGQEYFINSQELESKVRSLLPSQGGAGAGFDLSASTQIIPVIDLTESAEGSNLRQDLQTSMSFKSITAFNIANTTTTIINNTGYYRVFGSITSSSNDPVRFSMTDGATTKILFDTGYTIGSGTIVIPFDFVVFLAAGDSFTGTSGSSNQVLSGSTRQIANITGELVDPS